MRGTMLLLLLSTQSLNQENVFLVFACKLIKITQDRMCLFYSEPTSDKIAQEVKCRDIQTYDVLSTHS